MERKVLHTECFGAVAILWVAAHFFVRLVANIAIMGLNMLIVRKSSYVACVNMDMTIMWVVHVFEEWTLVEGSTYLKWGECFDGFTTHVSGHR